MAHWSAEEFEHERARLTAFAYRLLGRWSDAEDVVQEAWLRFQKHAEVVETPAAWLRQVVTHLCLDLRKSAQATRETYVGPWLPEPVSTEGGRLGGLDIDLEAISLAFLTMLERLSPLERAVYLLSEAFDHQPAEIAQLLDREPAAVRQLLHRAREHVKAGRPRFAAKPDEHQRALEQFLAACMQGDLTALTGMLKADAVALSDGGGKIRAALNPIEGADRVARFLIGVSQKPATPMNYAVLEVNGTPTLVGSAEGRALLALQLELDEGLIRTVSIVLNPDKLASLKV